MILATDMAKHMADMSALKALLEQEKIKNGQNVELLVSGDNEKKIFENQQFLMEVCLHACDVSQQTRTFEVTKTWTYLLFEEFFDQGDVERQADLPITMLCDRYSTNVATS